MIEVTGDLWTYPADAVVVPVNWTTRRDGTAVMGAGVAKQAAERYRMLPWRLGRSIENDRDVPRVTHHRMPTGSVQVVTFPTKRHWRERSSVEMIEERLTALLHLADINHWQTVALPRLGCGLGGLRWEDVRAVLAAHLDDRFVVVVR